MLDPNKLDTVPKFIWLALEILGASGLILTVSVIVAAGLSDSIGNVAAWVQAVGATFAIISGFAGALLQMQHTRDAANEERNETARAARRLAHDAFALLSDRLEAAISKKPRGVAYSLRELRTSDMIKAMREFDTARLPASLISDFIKLRACLYAINSRVSEAYRKDDLTVGADERRLARHKRLRSAVAVHRKASEAYSSLNEMAVRDFGGASLPSKTQPTIKSYRLRAIDLIDT